MAGIARPNLPIKGESRYTVNGYSSAAGTGAPALFDGSIGSYGTLSAQFWYGPSNYVDITIEEYTRLWNINAQDPGASYNNPLIIKKWNGAGFVEFGKTNTLVSPYGEWQVMFDKLPAGRYRFEYSGGNTISTEWYLENISSPDHSLLFHNGEYKRYLQEKQEGLILKTSVPQVTSNNDAGFSFTASSEYESGGHPPHTPFRGNTGSDCWATRTGILTGWLQVKFPTPIKLFGYSIQSFARSTPRNSDPKNWTIMGSNDGINFVVISSESNIVNWQASEKRIFKIQNPGVYQYYRINITANNGYGSWTTIGRMELFDQYQLHQDEGWEIVTVDGSTSFLNNGMKIEDLEILGRSSKDLLSSMEELILSDVRLFSCPLSTENITGLYVKRE